MAVDQKLRKGTPGTDGGGWLFTSYASRSIAIRCAFDQLIERDRMNIRRHDNAGTLPAYVDGVYASLKMLVGLDNDNEARETREWMLSTAEASLFVSGK